MTLGSVTDEGEGVILEVLLELGKGPVYEVLNDARRGEGKGGKGRRSATATMW